MIVALHSLSLWIAVETVAGIRSDGVCYELVLLE